MTFALIASCVHQDTSGPEMSEQTRGECVSAPLQWRKLASPRSAISRAGRVLRAFTLVDQRSSCERLMLWFIINLTRSAPCVHSYRD